MTHAVYAGITVDIAEEGFDRVQKILAGISGGANKAVGNALTRAANAGKTVAKQAVTQEYTLSQGDFMANTKNINNITRASDGGVSISFGYRGNVIPLMKFDTKVDRNGRVTTHVMRSTSRTALNHAFKAKMGNHTGIYERELDTRFPVKEKFGPATPQMMYANEEVMDKIEEKMSDTYEKRIEHEITRLLNGWGK